MLAHNESAAVALSLDLLGRTQTIRVPRRHDRKNAAKGPNGTRTGAVDRARGHGVVGHRGPARHRRRRLGGDTTPKGGVRARATFNDTLAPGVVFGQHGWFDGCEELGLAGHPPFGPGSANLNLVLSQTPSDPISGSSPLRAQMCEVTLLAEGRAAPGLHRIAVGPALRELGREPTNEDVKPPHERPPAWGRGRDSEETRCRSFRRHRAQVTAVQIPSRASLGPPARGRLAIRGGGHEPTPAR